MKRSSKLSKSAKLALTAAFIGAPMLISPDYAIAEKKPASEKVAATASSSDIFIKIEWDDKVSVVGTYDNNVIFKNTKGEYFQIDRKTGDFKYLSSDIFIKMESSSRKSGGKIFHKVELNEVFLVGIDNKGNIIQRDTKGEQFYIDAKTGDRKGWDGTIKGNK